jgi:hypothetical protein
MSSFSEEDATKLEKLVGVLEHNTLRGIELDARFTPPPSE